MYSNKSKHILPVSQKGNVDLWYWWFAFDVKLDYTNYNQFATNFDIA